jgi:undecaprenyl-diphosphatase
MAPTMDALLAAKAVIMGVVEGLTEFIPVSSTGHLIVTDNFIGFEDSLRRLLGDQRGDGFAKMFEVVIQLGAILSVCWYYRDRILRTLGGAGSDPVARGLIVNLVLAFIPAAVIGLATHHLIEHHLMRPEVVAATLAVGGFAIIAIEARRAEPRLTDAAALPPRIAFAVGCCQCLALLPGISRSGATIMGALLLGVARPAATEFSFFLAIPTMFAACGFDLVKHRHDLDASSLGILTIGFVVSFVVALVVVHWLLHFVAKHRFTGFGWYRIAAGLTLAVLIWYGVITAGDLAH